MSSSSRPETETARWYADKVARFGYDHRGLGFRSRSAQEKRFEALLALGELDGRRVLDVGCGFGDLLGYLEQRGIRTLYTGIDLCGPMIQRCRERYPVSEGRFVECDVMEYRPDEPYDFVLASGIFGLDAEGVRERIQPTLARMFGWAREGLAVNFLSALSPAPAEGRVYVDPCEAMRMAASLTPSLRIDHTYLPNDFTLHLFRHPAWEGEKARPR